MPGLVLIAGEGELPGAVITNALKQGKNLFVYALDRAIANRAAAQVPASKIRRISPGLLLKTRDFLLADEADELVFAGKVNKWILMKSPQLDSFAISLLKQQLKMNDDALMHTVVREIEALGITVQAQTDFMQGLFLEAGTYTTRQPSESDWQDIHFGMSLANEMGRLDVGQTVVVHNGMVLAVEAIEGTDQAIMRAKRWGSRKGGVVAKVEKPNQDLRFDVPTVGPRTLNTMKKAGVDILAIQAGKTIVLEREKLVQLANRWNMVIVSV